MRARTLRRKAIRRIARSIVNGEPVKIGDVELALPGIAPGDVALELVTLSELAHLLEHGHCGCAGCGGVIVVEDLEALELE